MPKATKRERQRQNREYRRQAMHVEEQRRKRMHLVRNIAIAIIPIAIIIGIAALASGGDDDTGAARTTGDFTATIETSKGTIVAGLDGNDAPTSVEHFVKLAREGFYDGLLFNRVAKDFVIQTGSPDNTTAGGSGTSVQGEVPKPQSGQPAYPVGTIAFAKAGSEPAGTADSQFFIVTGSGSLDLPADYALIGHVTSGLDVAQAIGQLYPASGDGTPTEQVTVEKITITKGLPAPTTTS